MVGGGRITRRPPAARAVRSCCGTTAGSSTRRPICSRAQCVASSTTGSRSELRLRGNRAPTPAPELVALGDLPRKRLRHFGYAAAAPEYRRLLHDSDIVVSTSRHEFFGVAMVEALFCGLSPLAPNGYNYPALVPTEYHDTCLFDSGAEFEQKLSRLIIGPRPDADALRESAARFAWSRVTPVWEAALDAAGSRQDPLQKRSLAANPPAVFRLRPEWMDAHTCHGCPRSILKCTAPPSAKAPSKRSTAIRATSLVRVSST